MKIQFFAKILLATLIAVVITLYISYDIPDYLKLDTLQQHHRQLRDLDSRFPVLSMAIFFMVYVLVTALSLPGASILTLAAGAVFDFGKACILVSFASSLGASLAFLCSRFFLQEMIEKRFGDRLTIIQDGIRREGAYYLLTLRLVPIFPFFLVNILMGVTPMRLSRYYWVTQLGMIPGTLLYVNAGTQIAHIRSLADIVSLPLLLSLTLLGIFPIVTNGTLKIMRERRILRSWPRPKQFDYNIVVIGAGSGGLVSAYIAAALKAKVALIEKHEMGGDCLNTGCVPSKALIRTTRLLAQAKNAKVLGLESVTCTFQFAHVMERVQRIIQDIAPHDSATRYASLGVDVIRGTAKILSAYRVQVGEKVLTTRNIIVATGASPLIPDLPGLDTIDYLTSETIWSLRVQPHHMLILGGGPIACEMAQAFCRLGSKITLLEMSDRILQKEDGDVSDWITTMLQKEGVTIKVKTKALRVEKEGHGSRMLVTSEGQEEWISFDKLLLAIGRRPRTSGFGLEELEVNIKPSGTIEHDFFLRTNIPNIYCVGDVAGPFQLTHVAAHQAWYATVNALFSPFKRFRADYRVIPRVTFTDPEIAHVGLTESDATQNGIAYEVYTYGLDDLDRAIADSENHGFVKVLVKPGSDVLIGATVLGSHAGETIIEFTNALKHGIGLNKILSTIHPYPTFSEANKYIAGTWKRKNAPKRLLKILERFHTLRR